MRLSLSSAACVLSLLFMALFPAPVRASSEEKTKEDRPELTELSIEELMEVTVTGASRYKQKLGEAPSSVTIITQSEIKKHGYRSLAEVLQGVRGISTSSDRNYDYIGVRGFARPGDYNTRVLLLVDGHRINDNVYDQAMIGRDFIIDVDLIERVEVIRGPTSSLYGTNAFFGVINVITRRARDYGGAEASGEAGSLRTFKSRFSYGNAFPNGLKAVLSASYFDSAGNDTLFFGEFNSPATNNGIAEGLDFERSKSLFGDITFGDFTLQGAYVYRKKGVPTASFGTVFNDSRFFTADNDFYADLKYEHSFPDRLNLLARLNYNYHNYYGDYPLDYAAPKGAPDVVLNRDYSKGEWWGGELQVTKSLFERHKIIAGAEYRDNLRQDQGNYDREVYLDDRRKSKSYAFYIQDEIEVLRNLILNAGMRYDHFKTFGGTTNPRIALIYGPSEKTVLKLLYGKAFRAPNVFELFYNDLGGPSTTKPNPDLRPETIRTYELILEQRLGSRLKGTIVGFYYKIDNLIAQHTDEDGLLVFRNVDEAEARGLEFELEGRWSSGYEGRVTYTLQRAEDSRTSEVLTNSPRHALKMNVIVPLLRQKLFLGLEERYTSRRRTLAGDWTKDSIVTNLTLFSHHILKGSELSASVYNLFDKRSGNPGAAEHLQDIIEQDGRSFRVKFTYAF